MGDPYLTGVDQMIETGQLLVAPPAQDDDYWNQTVIFLYEKTEINTIGLIVNKVGDRSVRDLAEHNRLSYDGEDMLYIGGPVNPHALVLLHTNDWRCSNTYRINSKFSVSSDRSMLDRICGGDRPSQWKMFLGMSAWKAGQLENELLGIPPWNKKRSWLVCPSSAPVLFDKDQSRSWKKAVNSSIKQATDSLFQIS